MAQKSPVISSSSSEPPAKAPKLADDATPTATSPIAEARRGQKRKAPGPHFGRYAYLLEMVRTHNNSTILHIYEAKTAQLTAQERSAIRLRGPLVREMEEGLAHRMLDNARNGIGPFKQIQPAVFNKHALLMMFDFESAVNHEDEEQERDDSDDDAEVEELEVVTTKERRSGGNGSPGGALTLKP